VLFRKVSATRWIVQHKRTITLRQRGQTTSQINTDATATSIPVWVISQAGLVYDGGVLRD
jgi:hypothetical protein